MSEMIKRIARAMHDNPGSAELIQGEAEHLARVAIEAMRDFKTEDFTLTEAAGIRRLFDAALESNAALAE